MVPTEKPVYIVAVSGGVDSVVLLHMLIHGKVVGFAGPDLAQYVVAHVNHGIRDNSGDDQQFVRNLAEVYGLVFETSDLGLGKDASEDEARSARYEFLEEVARKHHTSHIIIAHHGDDVVETAVLNIIRGTGRSGLSSLRSKPFRVRPLLHMRKQEIKQYADDNNLEWVEDSTNLDNTNLRNHIRNVVLPKASEEWHSEFATLLQKSKKNNDLLDNNIATLLQYRFSKKAVLKRSWFALLDHTVACEVMRAVLLTLKIKNITKELIERLVVALKTGKPGSVVDIDGQVVGHITKRSLRFVDRETKKTLSV